MNHLKIVSKSLSVLSLLAMFLMSSVQTAQAASIFKMALLQTTQADQNDQSDFNGYDIPETKKSVKSIKVDISAYTSAVNECDGSPFITADGSVVADGIVATNILPIGTKIRIPAYFGDRVFEVHDRMNARYSYRVDIWMGDLKAARTWGVKRNATIEVVEMGDGKKNWDQWKGRAQDLARIGKYGPDKVKEDES